MHIIESWGTGIPRLYNRSAEYGLPEPLFEEFGDGIKVTMFRKVSNADEEIGTGFDKYLPLLKDAGIMEKFIENIEMVFVVCGVDTTFGEVNVQEWLACSKSKSTNLMNAMKKANIIKGGSGEGFGKYQFIQL